MEINQDSKLFQIVIAILIIGTPVSVVVLGELTKAQATGGGEVIELVIPMIDDTIKSIQNNDTDRAISQLEEIKTELKDTFFAEEEN